MNYSQLDLPDLDCWIDPAGELRQGDLCQAVPLPRLADDVELAVDDGPPQTYWVEVEISWALVLWSFDAYATLAPIAVPEVAFDPEQFDQLVESARSHPAYIRLPDPEGTIWGGDAVALTYSPHTRLVRELEPLRVASMSEEARQLLAQRLPSLAGA